jgi:hypothetical protein
MHRVGFDGVPVGELPAGFVSESMQLNQEMTANVFCCTFYSSSLVRRYGRSMTSWGDFKALEPQLAELVERLFAIGRHKTLATLRADGSPRISGIECAFDEGNLHFGSMEAARKSADIHRDPRIALHSPTVDPIESDEAAWPGEAKIAGIAISAGPIEGPDAHPGEQFVVDVAEVVVVHLNDDATKLVVEWWTPDGGHQFVERA